VITELATAAALLTTAGALPTLATVGFRPIALLMVAPVGALVAASAATIAVATGTALLPWFVVVAVGAGASAGLVLKRLGPVPVASGHARRVEWITVVAVIAASAWALTELRRPGLGWDARSIWLLHARLLDGGGASYDAALGNPAYSFAHMDYPPLMPAAVATTWSTVGSEGYRLAQVLIAGLNACLLGLTAATIASLTGNPGRRVLAPFIAAAVVLAGFGIAGGNATGGYADLLGAAATAAAATCLLVLPLDRSTIALGGLCALVAGTTKLEALMGAVAVAALFGLRIRPGHGWRRAAAAAAAIGMPMLIWPAVIVARGGSLGTGPPVGIVHEGSIERLRATIDALAHRLPTLPWVAAGAVLAALLLRGARRRGGVGGSPRLWAALGAYVIVVVVNYVRGPLEIHAWLRDSVDRVAIYPRLLLVVEVATWTLVAATDPGVARHGGDSFAGRGHRPHHDATPVGRPANAAC
jgi:hypothetical protein